MTSASNTQDSKENSSEAIDQENVEIAPENIAADADANENNESTHYKN